MPDYWKLRWRLVEWNLYRQWQISSVHSWLHKVSPSCEKQQCRSWTWSHQQKTVLRSSTQDKDHHRSLRPWEVPAAYLLLQFSFLADFLFFVLLCDFFSVARSYCCVNGGGSVVLLLCMLGDGTVTVTVVLFTKISSVLLFRRNLRYYYYLIDFGTAGNFKMHMNEMPNTICRNNKKLRGDWQNIHDKIRSSLLASKWNVILIINDVIF